MGRRAKPAEIKEAQGNPGKRRPTKAAAAKSSPAAKGKTATVNTTDENGAPVLPAVADDSVPAEIKANPTAVRAWKDIAPMLARMRLFRMTDRHALVRYCAKVADWIDVRRQLEGTGHTYETDSRHGKMMRINPLFMVQERIERGLIDLEDRFGLNPAARQKILAAMAAQQMSLPLSGSATAADQTNPAAHTAPPATDAEGSAPSPVGALSNARLH